MAANVRQRPSSAPKNHINNPNRNHHCSDDKGKRNVLLSSIWWYIILAINLLIIVFVHQERFRYPVPVEVSSARPDQFVEERARKHLDDITNIGSRPVGSPENEVKTVEYLLKEIDDIRKVAHSTHAIEVESQRVSGSFSIDFLGGFASYYDNVNNILVKFSPHSGAQHSLLVNCHYDSVINGTGASDDAVSCCLMLEVLRVLSQSDVPLTHSIVFIFNGAEENILQASHGFITKHRWAKDLKAFVNLDSAGAGGKELLFQAGPGHPWMIHTYASHAPHPFASVVGQEVFESGLVPSDTDFRIYRDYGGLSGLDIAYIANGYVYHTPYDRPEMIPAGCIQRGGDNLLAVVKALASSPLLPNPRDYRHGKLVFFDVMGRFMVVYPARIGCIINGALAMLVFGCIISNGFRKNGSGISGMSYFRELIQAVLVQVFSWVATVVLTIGLACALDSLGLTMSWFTNTWLLIGLYATPALLTFITVHQVSRCHLYKKHGNLWEIEQVYFDATLLVFAAVTVTLTYLAIHSVVFLVMWVFFPFLLRDRVVKMAAIKAKDQSSLVLSLHLTSILFPSLMTTFVIYSASTLFIPIMGRAGSEVIPDILMGVIMAIGVIILASFQAGLVYVSKGIRQLQMALFITFITILLLVAFTPIGFPYSADPTQPTKQRHILHHLERTFHDKEGHVTRSDSGIIHVAFDRNQLRHIRPHMSDLATVERTKCEVDKPYCGWPFYFPLLPVLRETYWIPTSPLVVYPTTKLSVIDRQMDDRTSMLRLKLAVTGPSHINVYFTPREGVEVTDWSLEEPPEPTDMPADVPQHQKHYFIYYSYGIQPENPWQFWLDLKISSDADVEAGVLEIALGGHYLTVDQEGEQKLSPTLESYIRQMPNWTIPIGWATTYDSWII